MGVQVVIELVFLGSRALESSTFDGEHDGRVVRGEEDVPTEAIGALPAQREALEALSDARHDGETHVLCSKRRRRRTSSSSPAERMHFPPSVQAGRGCACPRHRDPVYLQHPTRRARSAHGAAI